MLQFPIFLRVARDRFKPGRRLFHELGKTGVKMCLNNAYKTVGFLLGLSLIQAAPVSAQLIDQTTAPNKTGAGHREIAGRRGRGGPG